MIENDSLLVKYNEIWNKIKKTLNIKFHSIPVYNEKYVYIKTNVKQFNSVVNTILGGGGIKYQKKVCIILVQPA